VRCAEAHTRHVKYGTRAYGGIVKAMPAGTVGVSSVQGVIVVGTKVRMVVRVGRCWYVVVA
jgi:hypothetical protein